MLKNQKTSGKRLWLIPAGLICLVLIIMALLRGVNITVLNPQGLIASQEKSLMVRVLIILLEIAIPALALFYITAWKYRESNQKEAHESPAANKTLVFCIWAVPSVTVILLTFIMWPAAHNLAPQKSIDSHVKPLTIQVIAMRWKWLFIYPEQHIATVNFVQIPVGTPVKFTLTADEAPMSSFWIPQLSGQLYAMTGHVNLLNVIANQPGDYAGRSAEINGEGFAGMTFTARASSNEDFNGWVGAIQQSPEALDTNTYQKLLAPSEYNETAFYSQVSPDLYATMLSKYTGSHGQHTGNQ